MVWGGGGEGQYVGTVWGQTALPFKHYIITHYIVNLHHHWELALHVIDTCTMSQGLYRRIGDHLQLRLLQWNELYHLAQGHFNFEIN